MKEYLHTIRTALETAFAGLDGWFDETEAVRAYRPANGGWSVNQILEHVGLTNHYLLILIRKGRDGALRKAAGVDVAAVTADYAFDPARLRDIGVPGTFSWHRPDHMEPGGEVAPESVRALLKVQLAECLGVLAALPNGEGSLYKTTMNVNGLGKLDVYEYLYFLARHAERHLVQLAVNSKQ
jgi:1,6-anhydro-N-acetylmuramate kinase